MKEDGNDAHLIPDGNKLCPCVNRVRQGKKAPRDRALGPWGWPDCPRCHGKGFIPTAKTSGFDRTLFDSSKSKRKRPVKRKPIPNWRDKK